MGSSEPASFETDVKPLFRERDQRSMAFMFDLWDFDEVSEHADDILERVRDGSMPCDGEWTPAEGDLFERWISGGKRA
jgi:hypothetical protein